MDGVDSEFEQGLASLLAPLIARGASQEEQYALTARARAFYEQRRAAEQPPTAIAEPRPAADEPAYPSSFAHVAQLIATGAPIPGIKHVPDKLNEAPAPEPQLAGKVAGAGRKPWETEQASVNGPSAIANESTSSERRPDADERPTIEHVFGYGSLIWKPPPHTIARRVGYVKGFVRRLAQASTDHRGTPEAPGRVLTLIPAATWRKLAPNDLQADNPVVWGVMWTIDPAHAREVRAYLDYREKDGYTCERSEVYDTAEDGSERLVEPNCSIYVGHVSNPSFVGPEDPDALARHIATHVGPSGPNDEYVYELAQAITTLSPDSHDPYLEDIARRVRNVSIPVAQVQSG